MKRSNSIVASLEKLTNKLKSGVNNHHHHELPEKIQDKYNNNRGGVQ